MLVMVNDFLINNYWEAFFLSNNPLHIYYYYFIVYMSHKKKNNYFIHVETKAQTHKASQHKKVCLVLRFML